VLKTCYIFLLSLGKLKHTIMKKLLFVLAFTFIGGQVFSQMYIVTLTGVESSHPSACPPGGSFSPQFLLTKVDPSGVVTYTCLDHSLSLAEDPGALVTLNQELNNIISQGYKLVYTSSSEPGGSDGMVGGIDNDRLNYHTIWYFAIPWTSSGLDEIPVNSTTLKSFLIRPNPANTFVDISLNYSLKGESEIIFISEAGYISHKESIGKILKNEKYNIDISKIPAGKYLVTIVNGKTYTTPQKLIVL